MTIECGQDKLASRANIFIAEIDRITSPLTATVSFNILVSVPFFQAVIRGYG